MPFYRFEVSANPPGMRYTQVGTVPLAGNRNGAIHAALKGKLDPGECTRWSLTADDLLRALGHDPATSVIIIDPTPGRLDEVTLLRLDRVSGYSYRSWTPIMLHTSVMVMSDMPQAQVKAVKSAFDHDGVEGDRVLTHLYLRGGFADGNWAWGSTGRVNGPLIWADAMAHFNAESARYP